MHEISARSINDLTPEPGSFFQKIEHLVERKKLHQPWMHKNDNEPCVIALKNARPKSFLKENVARSLCKAF